MLEHRSRTAAAFGAVALVSAAFLSAQGPPPPLLPPPAPPQNPVTTAKTNLGKTLFWDEQLSSSRTIACATCHMPEAGGTDPRTGTALHPGRDGRTGTPDDVFGSPGVIEHDAGGGCVHNATFGLSPQVTSRRAPPAIMAAYAPLQFWDGRRNGILVDPATNLVVIPGGGALENQVLEPPLSPIEMNHAGVSWSELEQRLAASKPLALATDLPAALATWLGQRNYPDLFQEAFGSPAITAVRVAMAIATYERSLVPNQAPVDQQAITPLPPLEARGQQIFTGVGRCIGCHGAPLFSRPAAFFHIGVRPPQEDPGRGAITSAPQDNGAFKVPSLRNVGLRTRFFHNGGKVSLEEVVDFYTRGGDFRSPNIAIQPFALSPQDRTALVAFLRNALTDPRVAQALPPFDHPTLNSMSGRGARTYGVATPGSSGRPPRVLAPEPAVLGNPTYRLAIDDGVAGAPAFLLLDTAPGQATLLGVTFNVGLTPSMLAVSLGALAGGAGVPGWTSFSLALPDDRALVGASVYLQAIAVDPLLATGLSASAGVQVTFFAER
ncbi:MAG: cytochrome c peroxidase [Planctomycetota bacterium]